LTLAATPSQTTLTGAYLISKLGSAVDFKLRAYSLRNGFKSLVYDSIQVRKV
jgi:hypothetical protein